MPKSSSLGTPSAVTRMLPGLDVAVDDQAAMRVTAPRRTPRGTAAGARPTQQLARRSRRRSARLRRAPSRGRAGPRASCRRRAGARCSGARATPGSAARSGTAARAPGSSRPRTTLMATCCWNSSSSRSARYTAPMPPSPSIFTSLYGPRRSTGGARAAVASADRVAHHRDERPVPACSSASAASRPCTSSASSRSGASPST